MSFVFKFNRIIVSNTSKYNLLEGIDLKNFCHENNIYCQNLNEIKKGYVSQTIPGKSIYFNLPDVCVDDDTRGREDTWLWLHGFIYISFVFSLTATSHAFVLYINPLWSPALSVKVYEFP